jgi:hypothetical protein
VALLASVSKPRWSGVVDTPFLGKVSGDRFAIRRVVHSRRSFDPMLFGRLEAWGEGTRLEVVMTFHPGTWLLLIGWSSVVGYFTVRSSLSGWINLSTILFFWIAAIAMFFRATTASKALLIKTAGGREHRH